jgi:GxxExxY protein
MAELIFKDEGYAIIGAAMEVYNTLGPGFAEPVYQEAWGLEFASRRIPVKAQQELVIFYKEIRLQNRLRHNYRPKNQIRED